MESKIIGFPKSKEKQFRLNCVFMNKPVPIRWENGEKKNFPCIVLYEKETNIPILHTGLEIYLCNLIKEPDLSEKTLSQRAYAVCHFLNFILHETTINCIHECDLNTINEFLKYMKTKKDGTTYNGDTWLRYKGFVFDFLVMYYTYNCDTLSFKYKGEDLKSIMVVKDELHHKKIR